MDTTLDRTVRFLPTDIIPGSYSPLTDRYPKADVDVTLREVIQLAVGVSDNGAEEILIRLVGGPLAVESYMHSLGISAIQVRYSERDLDRNEDLQYQDWIEPTAAVSILLCEGQRCTSIEAKAMEGCAGDCVAANYCGITLP